MFNLGIFTTLAYLTPNTLRAEGKLRNLLNMYDGLFSTEPCVALAFAELEAYSEPCQIFTIENYSQPFVTSAYLKSWHIRNPRHIQNTVKHLSRNILLKTLCNPDIFRNLLYLELWYILKSKHIQNPTEYLRWSILLRTLCNYSRFRGPIYSKLPHIQNRCVSATP